MNVVYSVEVNTGESKMPMSTQIVFGIMMMLKSMSPTERDALENEIASELSETSFGSALNEIIREGLKAGLIPQREESEFEMEWDNQTCSVSVDGQPAHVRQGDFITDSTRNLLVLGTRVSTDRILNGLITEFELTAT